MSMIALPASIWDVARRHLLGGDGERFGFFICGYVETGTGPRFCVREFVPISDEETAWGLDKPRNIDLDALLRVVNLAKREGMCVVEAHNHYHTPGGVRFSRVDDKGLAEFSSYMLESLAGRPYAAMVIDDQSIDARYWVREGEPRPVERIVIYGENQRQVRTTGSPGTDLFPRVVCNQFDRQLLLIGKAGQSRIGETRVGIVGLGGLGSHLAQQLAYLGVRTFVLIDPDMVELSNLNRLIGAGAGDVGVLKVEVARRMIEAVVGVGLAAVTVLAVDVIEQAALKSLSCLDVVFGCVDNDGPRLVLNEVSRAFNLPYMDLASGIEGQEGTIHEAGGRVAVVQPDGPCLDCMGLIDKPEARHCLKPDSERERDRAMGYVEGLNVPAPSVVSLNGAVASIAANEFLLHATCLASVPALSFYYLREPAGLGQRLTIRRVDRIPNCYTCSLRGLGHRIDLGRYAAARHRGPAA